jgi:NADH-quinone oxidoreductase subunit J
MHTILFNLYASLAITSGLGVIISKNPIHSVIFLILVFINATGLLLLFKIELLAIMFIIIYVGAIAVLFLFVVMMLNIKINQSLLLNKNNNIIIKLIQTPLFLNILSFILIMLILNLYSNYDNIFFFINQTNNIFLDQIHKL